MSYYCITTQGITLHSIQLFAYLTECNILSKFHSSFGSFHFTVTALLEATDNWAFNIDHGYVIVSSQPSVCQSRKDPSRTAAHFRTKCLSNNWQIRAWFSYPETVGANTNWPMRARPIMQSYGVLSHFTEKTKLRPLTKPSLSLLQSSRFHL